MKILKVYKQLTDVVFLQNDDGKIVIRSRLTDDGTEEEQAHIKETIGGTGFKASLSESARVEVSKVPPEPIV